MQRCALTSNAKDLLKRIKDATISLASYVAMTFAGFVWANGVSITQQPEDITNATNLTRKKPNNQRPTKSKKTPNSN